ncbi:3-oxoacyl-ACP reductase [Streptomyces sp. SID8379]|uniref:3-oxoacyl-ACP reductase n=1 Tax=unclassified Streptomyces TaxID=2593676 RepID=UPI0003735713|nr:MULTISPECIES: 3-oxoacyl-ACP reductase [unclassified Streptomyces]MYW68139.1 3-oxoacyl-ACP reductase [Streptomyces sp. SID8379]
MADRYLNFTGTAPGRFLTKRLGLPQPAQLRRYSAEHPSLEGQLLHFTAGRSAHRKELSAILARTGLEVRGTLAGTTEGTARPAAVVVDATAVADVDTLAEVHAALHPAVRSIAAGGRVVVLGTPPSADDHHQAAVQQGLEGFVRSLGKEIGRGRTVNLVRVAGPMAAAESTLRFLLSPRSAFVSGQVVEVGAGDSESKVPEDWARPLAGRTALVTGAARGIGEAVAETLVRDGARVVLLDVPSAEAELAKVAERLGGRALPLDITAEDAGERIAEFTAESGGLDVLVHNAGITRDRRLANMPAERWSSVLEVNLASVLRTTDSLLKAGAIRRGGAVVATASIAGIAGNTGQTNYAASKAGIVGLVRSLAPRALAEHGVTVNAVAPGFIETKMTAAVPLFIREAGRRMNSLGQGGLPVDVAETTSWFASAGSGAVNGQVLRVCGQSLLGA